MGNPILPGKGEGEGAVRKRSVILTALCIFSFIYFGVTSLLLLVSLLYSGSFRDLINTYVTGDPVSFGGVFSVLLVMFLLTTAAFTGTLLMWRMRRLGYYLFGIPVLIISCYQLFQKDIPAFSTVILVVLLILFGIFFRKLR
jgi:hypothetical protein